MILFKLHAIRSYCKAFILAVMEGVGSKDFSFPLLRFSFSPPPFPNLVSLLLFQLFVSLFLHFLLLFLSSSSLSYSCSSSSFSYSCPFSSSSSLLQPSPSLLPIPIATSPASSFLLLFLSSPLSPSLPLLHPPPPSASLLPHHLFPHHLRPFLSRRPTNTQTSRATNVCNLHIFKFLPFIARLQ